MLKRFQQSEHPRRFTKFCTAGLLSAVIDFGILAILVEVFDVAILPANAISFCLAATNSYFINKYWTFNDLSREHAKQFSKFFLISTIGLGLNSLLMWIAVSFGIWYFAAKAVIVVIVAFWNYFANHIWTFNRSTEKYEKVVDHNSGLQ